MKSTCKVLLENQANLETESKGQGRREFSRRSKWDNQASRAKYLLSVISTLSSRARNCARHQGKAVLRGPGLREWDGHGSLLFLPGEELRAARWAGHHHWQWALPLPGDPLPALVHWWGSALVPANHTHCLLFILTHIFPERAENTWTIKLDRI